MRVGWPLLLGLFDALMIVIAVWAVPAIPIQVRAAYGVVLLAAFLMCGMYRLRLRLPMLVRTPLTIGIITLVVIGTVAIALLLGGIALTLEQAARLWIATSACVIVGRVATMPVRNALIRRIPRRKTLIVGSGIAALLVAEKIDAHPELGLQTVGFVDEGPQLMVQGRKEPLLGPVKDVLKYVEQTQAEVVIFGYTRNEPEEMLLALYEIEPHAEVLVMPRFFQYVSAGMKVDDLAGMPLLRVNRSGLTPTEELLKRAEDLVLGGITTLLLLPFLPIVALAIKLDSPGPVFYKQERIGRNGKPFYMYKFRSMTECADSDEEALAKLAEEDPRGLKSKHDRRVTRLGAFLRKSSIDEMPQIINVLKGEMSLVGPRPAVAAEVEAYDEWQKKRLEMVPGITGMWQVSGRSDVPFDERIWLDFNYIDSWSVWLDLSILLQTVPAVLTAKGAY